MNKFDKQILVIDRKTLFGDSGFQGFSDAGRVDYYSRIQENYLYKRRGDMEENPEYKQPIAYVLIVNPDEKKVFAYQRAGDENYHENRLRGKWSWGIGGHIDHIDSENGDPIMTSLKRELEEEIGLLDYDEPKLIGYINDDLTQVGQVHFGLLFIVETDKAVNAMDAEISWGGFVNLDKLKEIKDSPDTRVESWSEISFTPLQELL
ncbi:MAG: NUDIX domain-containing protein [candidate division KSB1 bacterium]|nr:NUDIX domain-containing protein [candidate division KSB1 bacterium]